MNNDGIVVGDKDVNERITGQVNVSYQIKPWLKIGTSNSIERGKTTNVSENGFVATGSIVAGAYYFDPTTPDVYQDDSLIPDATGLLAAEAAGSSVLRDGQGRMYAQSLLFNSNLYNPLVMLALNNSRSWRTNINGTAYAELKPIKGLTFTSRFGYRLSSSYSTSFTPSWWANVQQSSSNPSISSSYDGQQYYQWENFANYLKTIGKHDISAMVGMEFASTRNESLNAAANGVTSEEENFRYMSYYDPSASSRTMGGSNYRRSNMSYFGRIGYTYDNRYNVQASLRADAYGMAKLSKSNRWGYFPSVSAGWTVSNEKFFKDNFSRGVFSFLKLRASWGINGNINSLSDFTWTNAMSLGGYNDLMDEGLITNANPSTVLANPDLTWEESRQVDLGVDARFFNDRLTLGVDFYNKNTTNMLSSVTAPAVSGASTTYINRGKINNRGWEFDLSWKDGIGSDFSYSITANLSTVKNEVIESPLGEGRTTMNWLAGGANFWVPIAYLESGYPMWYLRTRKVKGYNDQGVAIFYSADELGTDDGLDYSGSGIPDFTYGVTVNLSYRNWDFTVFGSGVSGVSKFLCIYRPDLPMVNLPKYVFEHRWTGSNAAAAEYPAPTNNMMLSMQYASSDMWAYDASYFKVKQIQLGYTLPKKALDALHIKGLRVYGSVENAFTFTKYPGNDPESQSSTFGASIAIDRVNYPSTRNYIFGLNLSF